MGLLVEQNLLKENSQCLTHNIKNWAGSSTYRHYNIR